MKNVRQTIEATLKHNPCLFFSGGADSLLLLYYAKDYEIPVITFAEDFTNEQMKQLEKIIFDWDLTLYAYPPQNRYFVPNSKGITLIDEYGFGGQILPVLRDVEDADSGCIAEISRRRFDNFDFGFQTILTGALKTDSHFVFNGNPMARIKKQGNLTFIAPLWDWTKKEVEREVKRLNLAPIKDTGEIKCCHRCVKEDSEQVFCHIENRLIPTVKWDKQTVLSNFRTKFGYSRIINGSS